MEGWLNIKSYIGNQFTNFTITWDFHMRIKLEWTGTKYTASCFPVVDNATPGNDPIANKIDYSFTNGWLLVICGVDTTNKVSYISTGLSTPDVSYISVNVINTLATTLTFMDNSPTNYGVTYLREVRLWSCYNCSFSTSYAVYTNSLVQFQDVLHYFDPIDYRGKLIDKSGTASPATNVKVTLTQKLDFEGNNIIGSAIITQPICLEDSHQFFNFIINQGCVSKYYNNYISCL